MNLEGSRTVEYFSSAMVVHGTQWYLYIGTRHEKLDDFANLKLTHPESIPGNMVQGNLSHITFARACQICSETFKNKGVEVL